MTERTHVLRCPCSSHVQMSRVNRMHLLVQTLSTLVYWQGFGIISENLEDFFSSDKLSQPENPIFESDSMSLRWVWCYTDL